VKERGRIKDTRVEAGLIAAVAVVVLGSCKQAPPPKEQPGSESTPAKADHVSRRSRIARNAAPPDINEPVGVASCDEWANRYIACIDSKAPQSARAQMKQAIAQTKRTWRKTAQTIEGQRALAGACSRMVESTRQATAFLRCTW
jgi:hypothetical protein